LNDALASEMVRVLRHRQYPMLAVVVQPHAVAGPASDRSAPASSHADQLAQRIVQLGGELELRATTLAAAGAPDPGKLILEILRENLAAERAVIASHRGFIRHLGGNDPITRRLLEDMLATAEGNVRELADRLRQLTAHSGLHAT
jgi:bacterioferritin